MNVSLHTHIRSKGVIFVFVFVIFFFLHRYCYIRDYGYFFPHKKKKNFFFFDEKPAPCDVLALPPHPTPKLKRKERFVRCLQSHNIDNLYEQNNPCE